MTPNEFHIGILLGAGSRISSKARTRLSQLTTDLFDLADSQVKDTLIGRNLSSDRDIDASLLDITALLLEFLEDSPYTNAGRGSELTIEGTVECDASIMLGGGDREEISASVGALPEIESPSAFCKRLIELQLESNNDHSQQRSVPSFMAGVGAKEYALRLGLCKGDLITERARNSLSKWKSRMQNTIGADNVSNDRYVDTVGLIVIYRGRICTASSSGGSLMKAPGRVGPAALVGKGLDINMNIAAVCSGFGEDICSLRLASRTVSTDSDLNEMPLILAQSKARLQRPPAYFGVLRATAVETGTLFEWYHSTESLICGFGSVSPTSQATYKIIHSSKPEGGGYKL